VGGIFGCRTLHGFCEGCGFFFHAEHPAREERTDRNRQAGKGESWIREPAPLNAPQGCATLKFKIAQRLGHLPANSIHLSFDFGGRRAEDRKTRTLEHHKSAPPESSKPVKAWAIRPTRPAPKLQNRSKVGAPGRTLEQHKGAPPGNSNSLKVWATRQVYSDLGADNVI
jgi:hypothetical protein